MSPIRIAVFAALFAVSAVASSVRWVDLDHAPYKPQFKAASWYTTLGAKGVLFVAGSANSKDPQHPEGHWLIKRSKDNGAHWEQTPILDEKFAKVRAFSISVNSAGTTLVATAEVVDVAGGPTRGAVRISKNGGDTWAELKESWDNIEGLPFSPPGKKSSNLSSLILNDGTILVSGSAYDADGVGYWIIKKWAPGANHWVVVDSQASSVVNPDGPYEGPHDSSAGAMAYDSAHGLLLVAGWWDQAGGNPTWTVKSSINGGNSWSPSDSYTGGLHANFGFPYQIFFDRSGNAYVVGSNQDATDPTGVRSACVIRRMDATTRKWELVESLTSERGCTYIGGYYSPTEDAIYVTQTELELVSGKPFFSGSVKRSFDRGRSWQFLLQDYKGPFGQGVQYNGITANALGEILVNGIYYNQPDGDQWIVKKPEL